MYSATTVRDYKDSIVEKFYNWEGDDTFPTITTILTGPNFDKLANLAYNSLNPIEINSYEIDKTTYQQQVDQFDMMSNPEVKNISKLHLQDVNKCIVSNFMDIDLMGTILTQGNTIRQLLEQQSYLEGEKCFIGTFSIRGKDLDSTFDYIQSTVGLILKSTLTINKSKLIEDNSSGKLLYNKSYEVKTTKRILEFDIHQYSDKQGPMVTFRLIYK